MIGFNHQQTFLKDQDMQSITQNKSFDIAGIELKTSNAVGAQTIPAHWQKFFGEGVLEKIPNKLSNDIYAVYTNFQQIGSYNECVYSLIIGTAVHKTAKLPAGLVSATIPALKRRIFAVKGGIEQVGATWLDIWKQPLTRNFVADYEHYQASGAIDIYIGVK